MLCAISCVIMATNAYTQTPIVMSNDVLSTSFLHVGFILACICNSRSRKFGKRVKQLGYTRKGLYNSTSQKYPWCQQPLIFILADSYVHTQTHNNFSCSIDSMYGCGCRNCHNSQVLFVLY